jgi:hypothetical protein
MKSAFGKGQEMTNQELSSARMLAGRFSRKTSPRLMWFGTGAKLRGVCARVQLNEIIGVTDGNKKVHSPLAGRKVTE